jgi:hypothetical protein
VQSNKIAVKFVRVVPKFKPFVMVPDRLFNSGRNLTTSAKWLYATLRSFANNHDGGIFPSYKAIMQRGGLTKNAVAKGLAELEHFGWIVRDKNKGKSNHYILYCPFHTNSETGEDIKDQYYPTEEMAIEWASREKSKDKLEPPKLSEELKEKLKR